MPEPGDAKPQAQNAALTALQGKFEQAVALQQQSKLADAERICSEVLRQQQRHIRALHLLGITALQTRHIERVVEFFERRIALNPDYGEAYYNRGLALHELKRPSDALASYDRAIALQPDHAKAHCNHGIVLAELKRYEGAFAAHDKAFALEPNLTGV